MSSPAMKCLVIGVLLPLGMGLCAGCNGSRHRHAMGPNRHGPAIVSQPGRGPVVTRNDSLNLPPLHPYPASPPIIGSAPIITTPGPYPVVSGPIGSPAPIAGLGNVPAVPTNRPSLDPLALAPRPRVPEDDAIPRPTGERPTGNATDLTRSFGEEEFANPVQRASATDSRPNRPNPFGHGRIRPNDEGWIEGRSEEWVRGIVTYDNESRAWVVAYSDPLNRDDRSGELVLQGHPDPESLLDKEVYLFYGVIDSARVDRLGRGSLRIAQSFQVVPKRVD